MNRLIDQAELDGWIPVRFYWNNGSPAIDWAYLGTETFREPSFNQTIERCLQYPFNLLFRHQTSIEVLAQWNQLRPGLQPSGFIFHMSRSGSTLVSQMLAAITRHIVISEAPPIDSAIRAHLRNEAATEDQRINWLRLVASALAQRRRGTETHFFITFDASGALGISLVRRAFPGVPWCFVYRDPVEVMVSQFSQRGPHTIPAAIDPRYFGMSMDTALSISPEEYCARVLASICQAALENHLNGGRLINYRELPEIVWSGVAPHLNLMLNSDDVETMKAAGRLNAKSIDFVEDPNRRRPRNMPAIREAAEKFLYPVYDKLETARARQVSG